MNRRIFPASLTVSAICIATATSGCSQRRPLDHDHRSHPHNDGTASGLPSRFPGTGASKSVAPILFPPAGSRVASVRSEQQARAWLSTETVPWEITKTESAGRTRISAVHHNGNVTEYYPSTSGPNGSTGRHRVTSRSTSIPPGHRHRP